MVIAGGFTVGMIFAFLAYKGQFLDAGLRFADLVADWKTLDTHVDRIADIALEPPEDDPPSRPPTGKPAFTGRTELAGVRFAYGRGSPAILRGARLTVEIGRAAVWERVCADLFI